MTMLSFRVDDAEATDVQLWATRLGIDKSELLRQAVHRQLARLASENDADKYSAQPLAASETSLATIADWGVAEDWSDWVDVAR